MLELLIIVNLALIIICICLTFKAFPKQREKITIILTCSALAAILFLIIYPNFIPYGSVSCQDLLQGEAQNVAAAIASYFSEPDHTKTPTINDLVDLEGYIPPEKRKLRKRRNPVQESDLIVFIRGDADDEIKIWVIAGKNQCPAGKAWVYNMTRHEGKWLKSYEEN
jgi:hypothetical protein